MAGAGLFWEKSTVGWLLVAGLFWEKSTTSWWLISQANMALTYTTTRGTSFNSHLNQQPVRIGSGRFPTVQIQNLNFN
jgi:hypothetical protein